MRIQYLVDKELDVISGGFDGGGGVGGGIDVGVLLTSLDLPLVAIVNNPLI